MSNPPTVLVVEDEQEVRVNLLELLSNEGFICLEAESVSSALAILFDNQRIDLIISDLMLGSRGDEGFLLLDRVRRDSKTVDLPFIFLTARAEREIIVRGMRLGASDYLTKPYSRSEMLGAIAAQLGSVKRKSSKPKVKIEYYIILNSPDREEPEKIILDSCHTIGRHVEAKTFVRDDHLSRRIGVTLQRMSREGTPYTMIIDGKITPQGNIPSANGVYVNGVRVNQNYALKSGDRVHLSARTWFDYYVDLPKTEEDEQPTVT